MEEGGATAARGWGRQGAGREGRAVGGSIRSKIARQGGRFTLSAEALIVPNHPQQSHKPGGPSSLPTP